MNQYGCSRERRSGPYLERLEKVLTGRINFTLVYDFVRREVCETVMRLVFVVEKDRGLLNHGPRLPKITEGRW